ncbi:MAG TPA: PIG-L deacetylase family protein [Steroidobacteraceae bacterium]|nr:PIG-L deacetylase family protein [Steroidobacteraceae bacterium]
MKPVTRALLRQFAKAARPYLRSYGLLRTSKIFNATTLVWEPGAERVVVLAPHMDDETIGCGGTLARHVIAGASVHVIFLTDGRHGSQFGTASGDVIKAAEAQLIATRKEEARLALETLGVAKLSFLDVEDGALTGDTRASARLRALLEADPPELVYLPCFLEQHPDHFAANRVLLEAAQDSSLHFQCLGYEVWTPLFPNCVVKIDEVIELKKKALAQYRSQLAVADYLHTGLGLNAYRSAAFSRNYGLYAEAFCSMPLSEYRALYDAYRGAP